MGKAKTQRPFPKEIWYFWWIHSKAKQINQLNCSCILYTYIYHFNRTLQRVGTWPSFSPFIEMNWISKLIFKLKSTAFNRSVELFAVCISNQSLLSGGWVVFIQTPPQPLYLGERKETTGHTEMGREGTDWPSCSLSLLTSTLAFWHRYVIKTRCPSDGWMRNHITVTFYVP